MRKFECLFLVFDCFNYLLSMMEQQLAKAAVTLQSGESESDNLSKVVKLLLVEQVSPLTDTWKLPFKCGADALLTPGLKSSNITRHFHSQPEGC